MTVLTRELATYEREKARLLAEARGKFVLIKGDDVIGTYDTQTGAIDEGWRRYGDAPILLKQIVDIDPIYTYALSEDVEPPSEESAEPADKRSVAIVTVGAGVGAVIAGPPGALVGGAVGWTVDAIR
ncbi:hypothetical protein LCGC14_2640490, partial [marine sediment metagenome]